MRQILGYWMIGLMIGGFSIVSLALGLRGMVHRTPFMIASRKLYQLSVACYLPALAYFLLMLFPLEDAPLLRMPGLAVPLAISVLLLVFVLWLYSREPAGYTFMGARPVTFYQALKAALQQMEIDYQEAGTVFRINDSGLELRFLAAGWIGLAQLKAGRKESADLLEEIARCMEAYLEGQGTRPTLLPSAIYVVMGVLLMGMTVLYVAATGPVAMGLK